MEKLDKQGLFYNEIQYMVEAYNIFYGEYPTFYNYEEEKNVRLNFQLMMTLLAEYNVLNKKYNDYSKIKYDDCIQLPYSTKVNSQFDFLASKIRRLDFQEAELESLCQEYPLLEIDRVGIKSVSYIIKKQVEKEEAESPIEFLKQLSNILYYRSHEILSSSINEKILQLSKGAEKEYQKLGYTQDMIIEKINFFTSKLKLFIEAYEDCDINEVIIQANQDGMNDDINYSGLLGKSNLNNKVKKII